MAQPQQTPFSRLYHSDPATNRIFQDVYDKLQQAQKRIAELQAGPQAAQPTVSQLPANTTFVVPSFSAAAGVTYSSPAAQGNATESNVQVPTLGSGKFATLMVNIGAVGAGGSIVFTLRVNGLTTALSVIVPASSPAHLYYSVSGAEVEYNDKDLWDLAVTNNSGSPVSVVAIALRGSII